MHESKFAFLRVHVFLLLLVGCSSSNLAVGAVEENTAHKTTIQYQLFNGSRDVNFVAGEGEVTAVTVSVTTESGTLNASIFHDEDSEIVYQGTAIPISSFEVEISKGGTYTIHVEGKKHRGSYAFCW